DGSSPLWRSLPPPPRPSDLVSSWSRPRDWSASRGSESRGSSPQRASNIEDLRGKQRKTRVHAAVQQRRRCSPGRAPATTSIVLEGRLRGRPFCVVGSQDGRESPLNHCDEGAR